LFGRVPADGFLGDRERDALLFEANGRTEHVFDEVGVERGFVW
jgi:hypothetical protein